MSQPGYDVYVLFFKSNVHHFIQDGFNLLKDLKIVMFIHSVARKGAGDKTLPDY